MGTQKQIWEAREHVRQTLRPEPWEIVRDLEVQGRLGGPERGGYWRQDPDHGGGKSVSFIAPGNKMIIVWMPAASPWSRGSSNRSSIRRPRSELALPRGPRVLSMADDDKDPIPQSEEVRKLLREIFSTGDLDADPDLRDWVERMLRAQEASPPPTVGEVRTDFGDAFSEHVTTTESLSVVVSPATVTGTATIPIGVTITTEGRSRQLRGLAGTGSLNWLGSSGRPPSPHSAGSSRR